MNYRQEVFRTLSNLNGEGLLTMAALGLAGETGEVVDMIKKHLFHNKHLERDKIKSELGDVRWYLEAILVATGLTMEDIEAANVEKLRKRYPFGYSHEAAKARIDQVDDVSTKTR